MVIITGASTGIGYDITRLLTESKIPVLATVRNDVDAKRLLELGPTVKTFILDISKKESIAEFKYYLSVNNFEINILINNAGLVGAGPLEFYPIENMKSLFDVNVWGLLETTQICLPYLRKTSGKVINISSVSGLTVTPFLGPYNASKHAVEVLTDALRMEMSDSNVRFILVEPGSIKTPIWEKSKSDWTKLKKQMPKEAISYYEDNLNSFEKLVDHSAKNGLDVKIISELILKIIKDKNPKHRYLIGPGVRLSVLLNYLPSKLRDKILWSVVNKFNGNNKKK